MGLLVLTTSSRARPVINKMWCTNVATRYCYGFLFCSSILFFSCEKCKLECKKNMMREATKETRFFTEKVKNMGKNQT